MPTTEHDCKNKYGGKKEGKRKREKKERKRKRKEEILSRHKTGVLGIRHLGWGLNLHIKVTKEYPTVIAIVLIQSGYSPQKSSGPSPAIRCYHLPPLNPPHREQPTFFKGPPQSDSSLRSMTILNIHSCLAFNPKTKLMPPSSASNLTN